MKSTKDIAKMNDLFRTVMLNTSCRKVVLTASVADSPDRERVIDQVRAFDQFGPDNDPYSEHDFGKVTVNGTDYFWKIDYYDSNYEYGVDPKTDTTCLLLTIMRSDEY